MIPRDLFQNSHDLGLEGGEKWESQIGATWPGSDDHGGEKVMRGVIILLKCSLIKSWGKWWQNMPQPKRARCGICMLFINRNRA